MNLPDGMTSQKNYSKLTTIQKWLELLKRKGLAWIMNAWWNFPSPITSVRDKLRHRSRVSRNITDSLTWIPSTVHSAMTYLHAEKFFKVLGTRPETLGIIMYIVWIFFFRYSIISTSHVSSPLTHERAFYFEFWSSYHWETSTSSLVGPTSYFLHIITKYLSENER